MKYARILLMIVFWATALLACQSASAETPPLQKPVIQDDTPGTLPEENATQTTLPTLASEDTNMTPAIPPDEAAEKMVTLVKQHLAQKLSVATDQIVLVNVKPVVWRDAGLGCPKPGVDYIQVETPGYNILLEAGGKTYTYHTDETKRFVQCSR